MGIFSSNFLVPSGAKILKESHGMKALERWSYDY
jgi:hypothetical protein